MRPGSFSVSVDERDSGMIIENFLEALFIPGTTAACFLIRDTLEQETEFASAVKRFSTTSLAAPIYIIVGGVTSNQGAVITRDRMYAVDVWMLEAEVGRWFEVETNYDHWLPTPARDQRRAVANAGMNAIGLQSMTLDGVFEVLSTQPVLNSHTTYTTLMSAATGNYTNFVRTQE